MLSSKLLSAVALALALASAPALAGHSMSKRAEAKHVTKPATKPSKPASQPDVVKAVTKPASQPDAKAVTDPVTKPAAKPASSGRTSGNGHICLDAHRCLTVTGYSADRWLDTLPALIGFNLDINKPVAPSDAAILTLENGNIHYTADAKFPSTLAVNTRDAAFWFSTDARVAKDKDVALECVVKTDNELTFKDPVLFCDNEYLVMPGGKNTDTNCKPLKLFWLPAEK